MKFTVMLSLWVTIVASLLLPVAASIAVSSHGDIRPFLAVPSLVQIRDILAQLEAPIISALTERINLRTNPSLYEQNGARLLQFVGVHEHVAAASGRYEYGKLEYPFTLPTVSPDKSTRTNKFPPGRFHQDKFSGNANITAFYVKTLVPFFKATTSYYFHLDNSTINDHSVLNLDATLLGLLSHRAHIGKIVAEIKFAANATGFTPLIRARDVESLRVLVTNTTQEAGVLAQAATAATAFSGAWKTSGALVPDTFTGTLQAAAAVLFRELIDITTEIEIQYLLERLD